MKHCIRISITIIFFSIFALYVNAQVETRQIGKENDFWEVRNLERAKQSRTSPPIVMPSFDIEKAMAEDKARQDSHDGYRYGKVFDVSYTLRNGTWAETDDGRIWTLTIVSSKALSLNFLLSSVRLPEGAYIYLMDEKRTVMFGNITQECLNRKGNILTDILPGSSTTIYLYEPNNVRGQADLTISRVIHGYRKIVMESGVSQNEMPTEGEASSCNIDVACKPIYSTEAKAVGLVMTPNGTVRGSGSLLMTTDRSFTPYFLTAFHMIDTNHDNLILFPDVDTIWDWCVKFNYRKESCDGSTLATSVIYSGMIFVSAWDEEHTDFALVRLNNNVRYNTNLYYLGWDRSGTTPKSGVCIHHPKGDVMKISFENNSFVSDKWVGTSTNSVPGYTSQPNDHWKVTFDEGIMQDGSSGSPLLDKNRRVVGQMHGGPNNEEYPCLNTNAKFGKFSLSWLGGGTNSSQLKCWLDPNDTGATTMNGSYPPGLQCAVNGDAVVCTSNTYTLTGVPADNSAYTIQWSISNTTDFNLTTAGDSTCTVSFSGSSEASTTLTARVYYGSICIKTVTKPLYHHSGFALSGYQQAGYDDGRFFAARDSITYTEDDGTGISGYEISPCSSVTLISEAFRGMEISCNGVIPLTWEHLNNTVTFSVPYHQSAYGFQITGTSPEHCNDFTIPMRVDMTEMPPTEGGLTPYIEGYTLRIHFGYESLTEDPPLYLPEGDSWLLTAYRLGSPILTYSATIYSEDAIIPISTFLSGYYYIFRGQHNGNTYTCKVLIP